MAGKFHKERSTAGKFQLEKLPLSKLDLQPFEEIEGMKSEIEK